MKTAVHRAVDGEANLVNGFPRGPNRGAPERRGRGDDGGYSHGVGQSATVVVEAFNLVEGQGFHSLHEALRAAADAVRDSQTGAQRHALFLMDPSADERIPPLVDSLGVRVRHVVLPPGTGYDTCKDMAAAMADTEVVAYLDGDCVPRAGGAAWLARMVEQLGTSGAPGVGGITVYQGRSPLSLACSVLDFGFLASAAEPAAGGRLGCYASNNIAFRRDARVAKPMETESMRCTCYAHAQQFVREGTPLRLADHPETILEHELPSLRKERTRRGLDAVLAVDLDPAAFEARWLGTDRGRVRDVALFFLVMFRIDQRRTRRITDWAGAGRWGRAATRVVLPFLRLMELPGLVRALRSRRFVAAEAATK
ncbi:MAG: hypothetical protein RI900_1554 [Actinomycetota bacterium]